MTNHLSTYHLIYPHTNTLVWGFTYLLLLLFGFFNLFFRQAKGFEDLLGLVARFLVRIRKQFFYQGD